MAIRMARLRDAEEAGMIPRRALQTAIDGGYQLQTLTERCIIRKVHSRTPEWDDVLTMFLEGSKLPIERPWDRIAKDGEFWCSLCRALNRHDEKELKADFERRMKKGE